MKLYICILDKVPDYIVPTLVAHTVLNADTRFYNDPLWVLWKTQSFKKCVVRVNQKEFDKICKLQNVCLGYENTILNKVFSCAIPLPVDDKDLPNVLKFAKLWKPNSV